MSHDGEHFDESIKASLRNDKAELRLDDLTSWWRLFDKMREKHGHDGTWACFELLREMHQLHVLLQKEGGKLREGIIIAATEKEGRLESIFDIALRLQSFSQDWPDLYANTVHQLLRKGSYDDAIKWHLHLTKHLTVHPDDLAGLLSAFIHDSSTVLQRTLTSIYIFSNERRLYDSIIPVLWESGSLELARAWRRTLTWVGDQPNSVASKPFLFFLDRYFPKVRLSPEELDLIKGGLHCQNSKESQQSGRASQPKYRRRHSDHFTARWLASSWLSVDFVINFLRRLGLPRIGARSLQALALREAGCRGVSDRIAQLEKLGIGISPKIYCKVLAFFARNGEDRLLDMILHTDIHPDEFEDATIRRQMMDDAVRQGNRDQEKLLKSIEWALEDDNVPSRLNNILREAIQTRNWSQAQIVVDRMEVLKIPLAGGNAAKMLAQQFRRVSKHPRRWGTQRRTRDQVDRHTDLAIRLALRMASLGNPIRLEYWERLLFGLGRRGRFEELLLLSLEIVKIYRPKQGGLVPIYRNDVPPPSKRIQDIEDGMFSLERELRQMGIKERARRMAQARREGLVVDTFLIPAELSSWHHQHPLRLVFNIKFMKAITRLGFDKTVEQEPRTLPSVATSTITQLADFDIARGIRILAMLRDHGVYIDKRALSSVIYTRIVLGEVPRRRHRSRDASHVATDRVKHLVDTAWGSELLPSLHDVDREVERRRATIWQRYPVMFETSYGGAADVEDDSFDDIDDDNLLNQHA